MARSGFVASVGVLVLFAGCTRADKPVEMAPVEPAPVVDASAPEAPGHGWAYPQAERSAHVDTYHGVTVADPYRWLEAIDSPQTRAWIEAENEITFGYLGKLESRGAIKQRLERFWDFERWGLPVKNGDGYLVSRNDGLQNQSVIYKLASLDAAPEVLLDPNTFSEDGTVAMAGQTASPDGKLLAYGVSEAGSDWQVWRVRDVETGKDRPDEIRFIKFSDISWRKDGKGFYYARYDEPKPGEALQAVNTDQKVYFHELGTPQSADPLVYARADEPLWGFDPHATEDGRYLVITVRKGTAPRNDVLVQDLRKSKAAVTPLLTGFTAKWEYLGNEGGRFWFFTDEGAPRGKVVQIDLRKPGARTVVIPESEHTLRGASLVGGRLFANYLVDAKSRVSVFDKRGKFERDLPLPGIGSVAGLHGKPEHGETFFSFSGFAQPGNIYRYEVRTGRVELWKQPKLAFDPDAYETKQVFVSSKDGTKVPMFVVHKKGLKVDGHTPTYLYGYGGFNIPLTPAFSVPNLVWMDMGGVLAVVNLRGGGEYGEAWHEAGTKLHKQNVFDDFIAAAQWLTGEGGYTKPQRLAIGGRSNGGLLVGAAITQRPDLFGAALPGVGVMDMLRFNKFTIGWAWESDYGSPEHPEEFAALREYSPYHNLDEGTRYPATLVYTADHDDRVVPAHSYKFAAALQHAQAGEAPVLIRIDTKAGHGAGKPTAKQIEEWTDLWGFVAENLDMQVSSAG